MLVPINDPERSLRRERAQIDSAFSRVLASGWLVMGPENEALSDELSTYLGVAHSILVGNGTDALEIALRALDVSPGSHVLTVANAGGYTTTAINQVGALPAYVDIDSANLEMSPTHLRLVLNSLVERPAAIVVTHLFGKGANIKEIKNIATEMGIPLIEDCAQSLGASVDGQKLGSFGDISTTSFYPTKNLGALGDGGAIFTNRDDLANRARSLRQYGWSTRYEVAIAGGRNSRMDELQAAVVRIRLPKLDSFNLRRNEIHSIYRSTLSSLGDFPHHDAEDFVAHLSILITDRRTEVAGLFSSKGVKTDVHYPIPDHLQATVSPSSRPTLPVTEEMAKKILTIPLFPELSEREIDVVAGVAGG